MMFTAQSETGRKGTSNDEDEDLESNSVSKQHVFGSTRQVYTDFDVCIKLTVFEQFRPPDYENYFGFALSRLVFSPRMNELIQNFDIVISDNNMDIRNFLVLFASGTAGHETSTGLKASGL
jgi:hypothetical protein